MHKNIFKDNKLQYFMVSYNCQFCNFSTSNKYNYQQHLKTKKHLSKSSSEDPQIVENVVEIVEVVPKNVEKNASNNTNQNQSPMHFFEKSPPKVCQFCQKKFSRPDSLKRHISVCKLTQSDPKHRKAPKSTEKHQKNDSLMCQYCHQSFSRQYTLNRHYGRCKILKNGHKKSNHDFSEIQTQLEHHKQLLAQKEIEQQLHKKDLENQLLKKDLEKEKALNQLKDKTIEIARQGRQTINNKTINFLNSKFGDMITMEQFLHNLQHHEQLTYQERDSLLSSFKEKGMELFARNFSYIMKQNCQRQLLKEGLPPHQLLPLYCSDGNLRSHKEKEPEGWKTSYNNQSINQMINISSTQVYESHRQPIPIVGRDRNKIFKQIKQDNHANNEELQKLMDTNQE